MKKKVRSSFTSSVVGASSVGDKRSIGQGVMGVGQGVIGVGEDSRGGIRKGGVSLGLCAGECSEGYHQLKKYFLLDFKVLNRSYFAY